MKECSFLARYVWWSSRLVIKNKFRRNNQRPKYIFKRLPPIGSRFNNDQCVREFVFIWASTEAANEEFFDDIRIVLLFLHSLLNQFPLGDAIVDCVADELMTSKEFVEIWVMKWAEILQIRSSNNQVSPKGAILYHQWLDRRIAANEPLDTMVRELLVASGGTFENPPTN